MTNSVPLILLAIAFLFVFGCSVEGADLSQLDGNSYTLEVDRIANNPDVQFPSEPLQETDYERTDQGNRYHVSFSENAETVTVAGEPTVGEAAVMTVPIVTSERGRLVVAN